MTGLTWLHLSDWHQKGTEFDREIVLEALLKDIKKRDKISKSLSVVDFIVFSGDLASSGKPEEYQTAKEKLLDPILDATVLKPDRLFIVPGNHDLDRDELKLFSSDLQKPIESEAQTQEWLTNERKRRKLQDPFWAFTKFVTGYTGQKSPDYADSCVWPINGKKISIRGLNSALGCGRKEIEKGSLIIGEPQIRESAKDLAEADIKIAVLHHPLDWLAEYDFIRIERPLRSSYDFILCGHTHRPRVESSFSTQGNAVIIPAGASYRKRIENSPHYTSSYNFVHLDFDKGTISVFLRRWNDERGEWVEDISSSPGGQFNFEMDKIKSKNKLDPPASPAAPSVHVIPRQIPPPPRDFKGREEEIADILSNFEKGATITGLRGMGGVGKTALALVLADKIKSQFPDGQIFVDMRGTSNNPELPPLTPADAMAQIIRAYNPADHLPENSGELRGLYHSVLGGKSVLLLLDNAAGGAQVEPLLPPGGCAVFITSRIKFALPGLAEKDLDILPLDKSCELLLQIAPRIGNRAEELAKICGRLPLALRNAASALAEKRDLSVPEYQKRLKDKMERLKLVEGSFSLSYDLLTPGRKKQWRRLSVFPEDFDRNAATAVLKMAPEPSAEALSDLVRWSLLDYATIPDSEEGRYGIHDLARLFAESCLEKNELVDAQQKHSKYYSKVLLHAENLYKNGGMNLLTGLDLFDREWANIKIGQAWAKKMILISAKLKKSDSKSVLQLASSYAVDGANVLDLRLHPRDKIGWLETGLKAARLIDDSGAEGAHLGNLSNAYFELGEIRKSIGYCEQALKIARKIGDKGGEGVRLSNLGGAYVVLGEIRKAIEYYERALAIYQEIGNKRGEGAGLGSLGQAYAGLGETRNSIDYYEQALAIAKEIGDRRGEGVWLGSLGQAYAGLGETRKSIDYYELALAIAKEIGDRRGEGVRLGNLGQAYADLGELRKSIDYYELALAIAKEIGDRRGEGVWLGSLGQAYAGLGETRKSIDYYEQALAIAKEIGDRRGEGVRLGNLGLAYADLGETRKHIEYYDQALAIAKEIGDKRGEGIWLGNHGLAYAGLGETRKAIEYHDQALAISREIGDRRGEGIWLGSLGQAYADIGETRKAIGCQEQALTIAREVGDKQNEGEELCNLGEAYLDLNETDKTIEYCKQSLDLVGKIEYRKIEGEALCTLGKAYSALGQIDKALNHCDRALEIFKKMEYRRGEGEALFAKSLALDRLGQRAQAASIANEALQIFSQIESPLAEKVSQKLAEWGTSAEEN
jgi:tetratricopeptide (TPR) repeat protein/predicted MPP superfamily phosphohydrolase